MGILNACTHWDDSEAPHGRLVVIGNGFDLECGLPTSYSDFLFFASLVRDVKDSFRSDGYWSSVVKQHKEQHKVLPHSDNSYAKYRSLPVPMEAFSNEELFRETIRGAAKKTRRILALR